MPNIHAGVRRSDRRPRPGTASAASAASAEAQAHGGLITALLDSLQVGVVTLDNDGRPDRYLLSNAQPILDADGRQLGAVSTVLDVTERQRSERLRDCELQIARLLITATTIGHAAGHLVEAIGQALGWPYVSLMLTDPVADALRPVAHWKAPGLQLPDLLPRHIPRGRGEGGGPGHVWATGEPVWIPDLAASPYATAPAVRAFTDAATAQGLHTSAAVAVRDGRNILGVLVSMSDTVEHDQFLVLGMLTGIAEQIGHFLARQRSAELQAQLSRAKDDFLTLVGHEMRTPLTVIASYTSLLVDQPGLADDTRHMLSVINRNTDVLRGIIDQLLELTGLETGHHAMHPQPTDLSAVVTAAAAAAVVPHGIRLHTDVPATLVLDADPLRLRQVVDELLANAIKYSPDGGDIHLGVRAPDPARDDGVVELTVTDTGLGIPAQERELLFDRFQRGAEARYSLLEGAGLGLTLVRILVEAHGGTITIDPDHRPGTRIVVRLPVPAAGSAQPVQPADPTRTASKAQPGTSSAVARPAVGTSVSPFVRVSWSRVPARRRGRRRRHRGRDRGRSRAAARRAAGPSAVR